MSEKEYIEREEVLKIIYDIKENKAIPKNYGTLLDIIHLIRIQPPADVAEVKHGKWEWFAHNSKTRTCSVCHISQTVNIYNNKVRFKYCPYCGAKMDGKDKHNAVHR